MFIQQLKSWQGRHPIFTNCGNDFFLSGKWRYSLSELWTRLLHCVLMELHFPTFQMQNRNWSVTCLLCRRNHNTREESCQTLNHGSSISKSSSIIGTMYFLYSVDVYMCSWLILWFVFVHTYQYHTQHDGLILKHVICTTWKTISISKLAKISKRRLISASNHINRFI